MKKSARRPVGRPPGRKAEHRPVLTLRIGKELYDRLKESVRTTNRSMAEELTFRANQHYHYEKLIREMGALSGSAALTFTAAAKRTGAPVESPRNAALEAALWRAGYTPVSDGTGIIWFSPGMTIPTKITEAVREAVAELNLREAKP